MGVIGNTIELGKTMIEMLQAENGRLRDDIRMQREDIRDLRAEVKDLRAENRLLEKENDRFARMLDKVMDEAPMALMHFDPRKS